MTIEEHSYAANVQWIFKTGWTERIHMADHLARMAVIKLIWLLNTIHMLRMKLSWKFIFDSNVNDNGSSLKLNDYTMCALRSAWIRVNLYVKCIIFRNDEKLRSNQFDGNCCCRLCQPAEIACRSAVMHFSATKCCATSMRRASDVPLIFLYFIAGDVFAPNCQHIRVTHHAWCVNQNMCWHI